MQKVRRSPKTPPLLSKARVRPLLEALRQHYMQPLAQRQRRRAPIANSILYDSRELIDRLYNDFFKKCAFCESSLNDLIGEISHYRPLSNAEGLISGSDSPDHYSWFAYEWRNLHLACAACNKAKRNLFPVRGVRAEPMCSWSDAQQVEERLLLDPCVDDPVKHLFFDRKGIVAGISEQGHITIEVLHLNRPELCRNRKRVIDEVISVLLNNQSDGEEKISDIVDHQNAYSGVATIFLRWIFREAAQQLRLKGSINVLSCARAYSLLRELLSIEHWRSLIDNADSNRLASIVEKSELKMDLESRTWQRSLVAISIRDFKGIKRLKLRLGEKVESKRRVRCAMMLGENASGKSSVLQAAAMTLMTTAQRRALKFPRGEFVRRATEHWDPINGAVPIVILHFDEKISVKMQYDAERNLFKIKGETGCTVLAYGSRRFFLPRTKGQATVARVSTLFDPVAVIADPSAWLVKLDEKLFNAVARATADIFSLRSGEDIFRTVDHKVMVRANGRVTPIEKMSDGYRSLFAMALDIMRHMVEEWGNLEYARGIVLIDEIETHLHPRWKMIVMSALRDAMPYVQFIATTHDPLCLRGMQDGEVHVLYRDKEGETRAVPDLPNIETLRAEQILTSDFFGLSSTAEPEQDLILQRLAKFSGRAEVDMTNSDRSERDLLMSKFGGIPVIGNSYDRQVLAEAMTRHIRNFADMPLGERGEVREDSIDKIVQVLRRSMKQ